MDLHEDVIFKILLKLPVRSLLRFRCVCKDWCTLIKSSVFKDTYLALRRAKAVDDEIVGLKLKRYDSGIYKSSVTCWYEDYEPLALSASAPSSSNDVEISGNRSGLTTIIDHFNGIVCVCVRNRGNTWEENMKENWFDITLVNPGLREFRKLPVPDLGGEDSECKCYVYTVGFGYDDATDDYKVFAIASVRHYKKIGLVYHLSTNSWRILGDMSEFVLHYCINVDDEEFILCMTKESVFSHGSIHFIMRSSDPTNYRVLAFNLTSESFEEMLFPHGWRSYNNERVAPCLLTIDKSTIALVAFTFITTEEFEEENSDVEQVLDIWVMKEYGDCESWTKMYSISSSLPRFEIPLSFWRKDKLLLQRADYRLICYDLFTGQVYEYEDCDPIFGSYDDLSSKGQLQNEPGHCGGGGPLGWGLHFVTGHQSFVSLKQV